MIYRLKVYINLLDYVGIIKPDSDYNLSYKLVTGRRMQLDEITGKNNRWLAKRYGSHRGFIRTYWHRLLYFLGKYHKYRHIDWHTVDRLVFICKGNICRSAYAEAVARSLGLHAISCGIDAIENQSANMCAMLEAKNHGFNLEEHKTTPIMYLAFKKSDLLIVMEPWQCDFLSQHLQRKHHCTLLGLWGQPVFPHIQDPYGSSSDYFEKCFTYIDNSVNELSKKIKKQS